MKRLIVSSILFLLVLSISAQIAGINFSEAITINDDENIVYEKLTKLDNGYVIPFQHTPVGIKHCVEKFGSIMQLNGFNYDNCVLSDILLADYVDGLTDYGNLSTSLRVGSSEVNITWIKSDYYVALFMNQDTIAIFISNKQ